MSNVKITALSALTTPANDDVIPVVDVDADVTKKITIENLFTNQPAGLVSIEKFVTDASDYGLQLLAEDVLGSAGDNLDVSSLPARDVYHVLVAVDVGGSIAGRMTFNSDTGANYTTAFDELDNTAVNEAISQNYMNMEVGSPSGNIAVYKFDIINLASLVKIVQGRYTYKSSSAASQAARGTIDHSWVNTTDQVSSIQFYNANGGSLFSSGSIMKVWG